jgi:Zn-dependent protease
MGRSGIKVARLFGIDIYVDWSWLFIFLLVTWNLASSVFPSLHKDWSPALNWGLGLLASLLFFMSVLAHELAHSLVAVARGLPVKRIVLFIFGGVSNIEKEPPSPWTEFLVTIVGPLTSIILGIIFLMLGGANIRFTSAGITAPAQILAGLNPFSTIMLYLGPVNILLGLFNLIPGFPLDGGRVLRSILWAATKNLRRATRWATSVSHIVAWGFIVLGIAMAFGVSIPILGTGIISGLWLAFIGWFLNNAASQSYQQVVVEDLLEGVPVSRLMHTEPKAVPPHATVGQLVYDHIMGTDERSFPVIEGDSLLGLVCLEDVKKIPRDQWDTTYVRDIMTPATDLDTVSPRDEASSALQKLGLRDVNQMPVMQDGRLVGMLRRADIVRWLQLQSGARI